MDEITKALNLFSDQFENYQNLVMDPLNPITEKIIYTGCLSWREKFFDYAIFFKTYSEQIKEFPYIMYFGSFIFRVYKPGSEPWEYNLYTSDLYNITNVTFLDLFSHCYDSFFQGLKSVYLNFENRNNDLSKAEKLQNFLERLQLSSIKPGDKWPDNFL